MYIIDTINNGQTMHVCDNCNHMLEKVYRKGATYYCTHCHQPIFASILDFSHSDKRAKLLKDVISNQIILYFDDHHAYVLRQSDIKDMPYPMLRSIIPNIIVRKPEPATWDYIFWTEDQLPNQLKPKKTVRVQMKKTAADPAAPAETTVPSKQSTPLYPDLEKDADMHPNSHEEMSWRYLNRYISQILLKNLPNNYQHILKSCMPVNRYRSQLVNKMIEIDPDLLRDTYVDKMPTEQFIALMTKALTEVMKQQYPSIKPWFDDNCNCPAEIVSNQLDHKMLSVNKLMAHMDIITGEIKLFFTDDVSNGACKAIEPPFISAESNEMTLNLRIPANPADESAASHTSVIQKVVPIAYNQDLPIAYGSITTPLQPTADTDALVTWIKVGHAPSETSLSIIDKNSGTVIYDRFPSTALNIMLQNLNNLKTHTVVHQFGKDETLPIRPQLVMQTNRPGNNPVTLGMLDD